MLVATQKGERRRPAVLLRVQNLNQTHSAVEGRVRIRWSRKQMFLPAPPQIVDEFALSPKHVHEPIHSLPGSERPPVGPGSSSTLSRTYLGRLHHIPQYSPVYGGLHVERLVTCCLSLSRLSPPHPLLQPQLHEHRAPHIPIEGLGAAQFLGPRMPGRCWF